MQPHPSRRVVATDVCTHLLALLLVAAFTFNAILVIPLLVYGGPFYPHHWLLLARGLDLVFLCAAARATWDLR